MSEKDENLSELVKTRKLLVKKFEQTVKERVKREEGECEIFDTSLNQHNIQQSNDFVGMSYPMKTTSVMTTKNDNYDDVNKEAVNVDSNSNNNDVENTRLPTNLKRYIIRSTKTKNIKITPLLTSPLKSAVQSNKREKMLKSIDANGLCNRLRVLKSIQEEGVSTHQHNQEIDFILSKLREMQIIL